MFKFLKMIKFCYYKLQLYYIGLQLFIFLIIEKIYIKYD